MSDALGDRLAQQVSGTETQTCVKRGEEGRRVSRRGEKKKKKRPKRLPEEDTPFRRRVSPAKQSHVTRVPAPFSNFFSRLVE